MGSNALVGTTVPPVPATSQERGIGAVRLPQDVHGDHQRAGRGPGLAGHRNRGALTRPRRIL
jgi:hypothetical protein